MNERVAKMGDQVKQAFGKVGDAWKNQEPARRRQILFVGIGLIAFALGLVIVLNIVKGSYTVLYPGMQQDEVVAARAVLENAQIPARINNDGQLEVSNRNTAAAMGQLALQGIPSTTLDYNVMAEASGITTTEFEKRQYQIYQWQNRLQDTIKTLNGVQNAVVNLNITNEPQRAWDTTATKNSASVTVQMQNGYILGASQAYGIRYLVGSSVGIEPNEVTVMDTAGNYIAASGEEYDVAATLSRNYLERRDLEKTIEQTLEEKAAEIVRMKYPDTTAWNAVARVEMDFDGVIEEIKEYFPLEGTNHGVIDEIETDAVLGTGQYLGVVGETDNTDVPIYVDYNDDGAMDSVDYHNFTDYAVSYSLKQIERNGPEVKAASLAVYIGDASLGFDESETLRNIIAAATGLTRESVVVQGFVAPQGEVGGDTSIVGNIIPGIPDLFLFIAAIALGLLIIVLVLVMMLRGRARKKKALADVAAEDAEREEAARIQREIEERKAQLKNAATGESSDDAIVNEVREFARSNPEITASLLRNWLKEGE